MLYISTKRVRKPTPCESRNVSPTKGRAARSRAGPAGRGRGTGPGATREARGRAWVFLPPAVRRFQSRLAAARKITGISDLGDRFLPLFYVDDDTGSREASGGVQAFFDPKAAELVRKEAKRAFAVREADAFVLLRPGRPRRAGPRALGQRWPPTRRATSSRATTRRPSIVVLELECDVANSNCVISKIKR